MAKAQYLNLLRFSVPTCEMGLWRSWGVPDLATPAHPGTEPDTQQVLSPPGGEAQARAVLLCDFSFVRQTVLERLPRAGHCTGSRDTAATSTAPLPPRTGDRNECVNTGPGLVDFVVRAAKGVEQRDAIEGLEASEDLSVVPTLEPATQRREQCLGRGNSNKGPETGTGLVS